MASFRERRLAELNKDYVATASTAKSTAPKKTTTQAQPTVSFRERRLAELNNKREEARTQVPKPVATKTESLSLPSAGDLLKGDTTRFKPTVKPTSGNPEIDRLNKLAEANKAAGKQSTAGMSKNDYVAYAKLKKMESAQKDAARDKGIVEKTGQFLGQFYTPGGGLGAMSAGTKAMGNVVSKVAPKIGLGEGTGTTVAREMIKEGTVGALEGAGHSLAQNPEGGFKEVGKQALYGAGFGSAIGGAVPLVGKGIEYVRNAPTDILEGSIQAAVNPPTQRSLKPNKPSILDEISALGEIATGGMSSGIKRGNKVNDLYDPTLRHIVSGNKSVPSTIGAKADQAYINLVDDIFALNRFDEAAEKAKGRALKPTESVYQLAMASRGADQIAKQSLTNKLVDMNGDIRGDSLKDALQEIKFNDRKNFSSYLLNKHAITRYDRGEKVFDTLPDGTEWTPQKGQEIINEYLAKRPEFAKAEEAFRTFNNDFNEAWLVDSGLLPKEVIEAWKRDNPTYIDNQRQFSELEKIGGTGAQAKSGFGGQKGPVKKYNKFGSKRKVIDPIESMIKRYDSTIKAAKRNAPMQAMIKTLQANPNELGGLVKIVPDAPERFKLKDVDLSTPDGLETMLSRFNEDYERALKSNRKDLDNVVPVMVDGKPVYLQFENKQLLEAVLNVNPQVIQGIMAGASKLANFQKGIYTGINPIFTFTRSILRDPVSAYVNSKTTNNPIAFVWDLAKATDAVFRNKELYQEFKNIGAGYTSPNVGTPQLLNRTQRMILPNENRLNGIVQRFGDKILEGLDKVESVVRVAEYGRAKGKGSSLDDRLRGLQESQESSVNFKRRGARTKELEGLWIYFNSAVQSMDKMGRAFKDKPFATTGKIALSVTAPSLLLYAINRDDPDYQKLRDSEKDRFMHIPIGDGKFFRYPLPPELAVFANVPRRVLEQTLGNNKDAWNDFAKTIVESTVPPGIGGIVSGLLEKDNKLIESGIGAIRGIPVVGPTVEGFANKTWLGSPIVPGYLQDKSPRNQYNEDTSPIAKGIGKATNTSPMQLDYIGTNVFGDYGKIAKELATKERSEGIKSVAQGIGKRLVIDSEESNKLIDQFYDLKGKYDRAKADEEDEGFPKWYSEAAHKSLNRVSRELSAVNTEIRTVKASNLSKKDKDAKIKELKQKRFSIAQQAYEQFK